ncbi:MAG: hypothetical protein OHK0023_22740 [Anaerolineae bacterium]
MVNKLSSSLSNLSETSILANHAEIKCLIHTATGGGSSFMLRHIWGYPSAIGIKYTLRNTNLADQYMQKVQLYITSLRF